MLPGTPMGDLFPLGGAMGRAQRRAFPHFFVSFLGLSRFFWDFPDLLGDGPGIFPIRPAAHLSRDMSRLSRGHSVPLVLIYP